MAMYPNPSSPIRPISRPIVPAKANERLPLGAAMRLAKDMVTETHHYILLKSRHYPATIQGDATEGVYYIRYVNDHGTVEHAKSNLTAYIVQWLDHHDQRVALGDWDVQIFPRAEQLPTMLGVM